ncbi:hypothetical protein [Aeromonas rivipollensis]|uniref:H-NS family histone-like protein n=1 Tax=Aeromonas rivipollensis TaxID=948519 RepID=UPI00399C6DB3
MPGNGAMKPLSLGLTDSRSLRKALKVLSSEDLLMLNEEIEAIALERIEEEEIKGVKASERGQVVIPPFLGAFKSRGHAACARRCFGV